MPNVGDIRKRQNSLRLERWNGREWVELTRSQLDDMFRVGVDYGDSVEIPREELDLGISFTLSGAPPPTVDGTSSFSNPEFNEYSYVSTPADRVANATMLPPSQALALVEHLERLEGSGQVVDAFPSETQEGADLDNLAAIVGLRREVSRTETPIYELGSDEPVRYVLNRRILETDAEFRSIRASRLRGLLGTASPTEPAFGAPRGAAGDTLLTTEEGWRDIVSYNVTPANGSFADLIAAEERIAEENEEWDELLDRFYEIAKDKDNDQDK